MIERVLVFVVTTLLMLAVPGPDFVLVTRNAVLGGRGKGYRTVVGICAGLAVLTLVAASGLAALIAASTTVLVILRVVGGTYLLLLGGFVLVSAWRRRGHDDEPHSSEGARSPMVQGFLNNVLNPKALLFYLTFMPRFLTPGGAPVFVQTLGMGALVVICAVTWWSLYIAAVGHLRTVLTRGAVRTGIDVGAGTALGGLGAVALFGGV